MLAHINKALPRLMPMKAYTAPSSLYFYKIMIIDALALFAMFFGAGNMLFPLEVGVHGGGDFWLNWLGFILTGVGVPMIGLWANQLFRGNYEHLFSAMGKIPKNILIGLIILIIGPLFGAPRTETVTYASLAPFLPNTGWMHPLVSFVYFTIIFYMTRRSASLVDIVGKVLSPIKIGAFLVLILLAILTKTHGNHPDPIVLHSFTHALTSGYETMDLFAAIFFGSIIYVNVVARSKQLQLNEAKTTYLAGLSSIIGMGILTMIYTGLMYAAHKHAPSLQFVPVPGLIEALATIVLGQYGAIFVAMCITLACLATAAALAEVSTQFLQHTIFRNKVPRLVCLSIALIWMYVMSLLGFNGIMKILAPMLDVIYPLVAIYTFVMCLYMSWKKWTGRPSSI
jgi:LIVCS family branched-chain amino acid:cation transporter